MKSVSTNFKSLTTVCLISLANYVFAGAPTAIFHGMGDSCYFPGMWEFANQVASSTNNYATCIEIGWGTTTSILENFETQAEEACTKVMADPHF
jgi:Palmitoyl protein thioesterase